jgi:hypothetical protein
VEYVLAPDPNLGPWEALDPGEVDRLLRDAGLRALAVEHLEAAPTRAETEHRTRNMRGARRGLMRAAAASARGLGALPGVARLWGRERIVIAGRAGDAAAR